MRVVHLITRLIVGGAQENTLATVLGLRGRPEIQVQLLAGPTAGPEGSLEPRAAGIPGLLLGIVPHLVRPVHPWHDVLALLDLTRRLRETRPDIVHTHSGKAGILGRLAARRARIRIVVHTIHGPSFGNFQGPAANLVYRSAERFAGRWTTHFVAVAQAMIDQYLAAGIGDPARYTRIFSGFRLEPFLEAPPDPSVRRRWGLEPDDFVVGKIARLFKLKGHHDLLAVAPALVARCPRLQFLLVGDGHWRGRLEREVASLGLRRHFHFAGLVAPEDIPACVSAMDVLVHLSRREGLPRALPQALAAGRPVVAWDSDGAGEICRTDETGFLLRPGDRSGLVDSLLRLARDPDLRQQLGRRGREEVRARFSEETMVDAIHALYVRLLAAPPGTAGP